MARFRQGDTAYIVDNGRIIREVTVGRVTRDLCIIKYKETGAYIRIRVNRLFATEDEALKTIPAELRPKKLNHWEYAAIHNL